MKSAKLSAAIVATLAGAFASHTASAASLGYSTVETSNFQIFTYSSSNVKGAQADYSNLTNLTHSANWSIDAKIGNSQVTDGKNPDSSVTLDKSVSRGPLPLGLAPSTLLQFSAPAAGEWAYGSVYESGSPVTNVPDYPGSTAATLKDSSYVNINPGPNSGLANSSDTLTANWTWSWSGATGEKLGFEMDYAAVIGLFTENLGDKVDASWSISFKVQDLTVPTNILTILDKGVSNTASLENIVATQQLFGKEFDDIDEVIPSTGITECDLSGITPCSLASYGTQHLNFLSKGLTNGNKYQLTATITTHAGALVNNVPEPGSLALLGIGLMGLGRMNSRKSA